MRKIKYGKFLLLLIFVMSIVYSGGDVGSSKVVHAAVTTYEDFYKFNELPKSDIDLRDTFELITAEKAIGTETEGVNDGPSLDLPNRPNVAIITQDKQWQFGGLWYKNPIDMKKDFSMLMYVNLGNKWGNGEGGMGGGDGITFTIQGHSKTRDQLSSTIGANGAGLGAYSKAPDNDDPFNDYRNDFISNALVLEFDTFYNNREKPIYTNDNGTPNFGNGHIGNVYNGDKFYGHIDLTETPAWSSGQETFYKQHDASESNPYFRSPDNLENATDQDLTDNRWRKVEVRWDNLNHKLTYYIAGYEPIEYKFDNSQDVIETFGGNLVHWGFTGSTGASHNLQQVGIFEVPDQTESSIEKLARNITKDGENAEFKEEAIMKLGDTGDTGDTIEYQVTLDYPAEDNTQEIKAAVIEDKLPAGLKYEPGSLRVQLNGSDIDPTPEWNNGEIHLGDLKPGNTFVVTYQAVVKEEGVIDNTATFYSKYTNPISDTAKVYSGSINILKVNETDQPLEGAEFTVEGPNGFSENLPRDEEASSSTYKLDYLEPGEYTITETKAPDGYLPAVPQTVTVSKGTVDLKITFKNYEEPDVFKEQRDLNETVWGAGTTTLVGETVDFRLSAIAPTDIKEYVKFALSDQIDSGLDYTAGKTKVYINDLDTPLEVGDHYKLTEGTEANNRKLEVFLTEAGIAQLTAGDKLYVEFSAVVNESALGAGPIENTAIVDWDNNKGDIGVKESEPTKTTPEEGKLTITKVSKVNNELKLKGATFKLQRSDESGKWVDVANSSQTTGETGELTWDRLASGKYRLVETVAPAGYNLLANPIEFIIDDGVNLTHEFPVKNIPKGELPQTGGIGTAVFTITGLLLMMSAGLSSLITRIKKNN